jgi:hypothetical protein
MEKIQMRAGESLPLFTDPATASAVVDAPEEPCLGTTTTELLTGFCVANGAGLFLCDDMTWAKEDECGRDQFVAVFSCYVRAARRARWWYPWSFVVPCR